MAASMHSTVLLEPSGPANVFSQEALKGGFLLLPYYRQADRTTEAECVAHIPRLESAQRGLSPVAWLP